MERFHDVIKIPHIQKTDLTAKLLGLAMVGITITHTKADAYLHFMDNRS